VSDESEETGQQQQSGHPSLELDSERLSAEHGTTPPSCIAPIASWASPPSSLILCPLPFRHMYILTCSPVDFSKYTPFSAGSPSESVSVRWLPYAGLRRTHGRILQLAYTTTKPPLCGVTQHDDAFCKIVRSLKLRGNLTPVP
jgi:hypothetical protein